MAANRDARQFELDGGFVRGSNTATYKEKNGLKCEEVIAASESLSVGHFFDTPS